jgi:hypothetical protein
LRGRFADGPGTCWRRAAKWVECSDLLAYPVAAEMCESAWRGVDLSRAAVRIVMQELIETEAEQRIGAVRHECTAT